MSNFQAKNFFKIYLPYHNSQRMIIPDGAILCSHEQPPVKVTFRNCKGQCWNVELGVDDEINCRMYFSNGWRKFIDENSIKKNDLLVFTYVGNSVFKVIVLGLDGCEKSPSNPVLEESGNVVDDDDNDDDADFREEVEKEENEEENHIS